MSATTEERLESLKKFSPKVLLTHLDEERKIEYQLAFYPALNAFKIHRSDEPDLPFRLPLLTLSYADFVGKQPKLNPNSKMDVPIIALRDAWLALSEDEQREFYDNIPLNSLHLGANPPTQ